MINIDSSTLVGKGLHRECYVHPEDPSLCIKIVVAGDSSESQREQKYYRLLQKRNTSWEILARFYGVVDTNLGCGAVFDLIRNYDGECSKTLEHYLASSDKTESHYLGLSEALGLFKKSCFRKKSLP